MPQQARRPRILVASDDMALITGLDWLLAEAGFDTVLVPSIAVARTEMSSGIELALLLVDMRLPDGDQLDLVLGSVPVIVVGGVPTSPAVRAIIEARGGTIIDEPIEPLLRSKLEQLVVH